MCIRDRSHAGFTEFHAAKAHLADGELLAHQFVEADTPGDHVAAGDGKVNWALVRGREPLYLFGFNKGDVLARLVLRAVIPVALDSGPGDHAHGLMFNLGRTARGAGKDVFDGHNVLVGGAAALVRVPPN